MENKILGKAKEFYFMVVAIMMYYFLYAYIDIGLYITYRHAFALVLAFSAILLFLYKPDIARGFAAFKSACVYSLPLLVTTLVSMFIWFVGRVDVRVIARGLSSSFVFMNMFSAALGAAAMLYVFGGDGIWYNLIAIVIANIFMIITVIAEHGLENYLSELQTLVTTFAGVTGSIIMQAEIHELAFCLGAYLVYMLYKPRKSARYFILLALSIFCFISAFKRIAVIAIGVALIVGYLVKFIARRNKKAAVTLVLILTVILILLLISYVAIIDMGVFELIEKAGIDTKGRAKIYSSVSDFCNFSPDFLGNGIGFLTYKLNTTMKIGVDSIHNDFLQHFIDLGFWGYILWLVSITLVRVLYFGRKDDVENLIITFMLTLYLMIVSATDNTMNYPLVMGVIAILMMGIGFEGSVRRIEDKIFGDVCQARAEDTPPSRDSNLKELNLQNENFNGK